MKKIYLILAVLGAVIPFIFFIQFFSEHGIALPSFIGGLFVNGAAGGFTSDVLISSVVFWVFIFYRHQNHSGPKPWLFVILNLCIGLSCALPAYLYATHDS